MMVDGEWKTGRVSPQRAQRKPEDTEENLGEPPSDLRDLCG